MHYLCIFIYIICKYDDISDVESASIVSQLLVLQVKKNIRMYEYAYPYICLHIVFSCYVFKKGIFHIYLYVYRSLISNVIHFLFKAAKGIR
jgi:hypothetical protein